MRDQRFIIEWPNSRMFGVLYLSVAVLFLIGYISSDLEDGRYLEAFIFLLLLSAFHLKRKGFEFDRNKQRARIYYQIVFWRLGSWKSTDRYNKILFRTYSYVTRDSDGDGIDERRKKKDFQIYLVGNKIRNWKVYTSRDYQTNSKVAETLSSYTDFEIIFLNH